MTCLRHSRRDNIPYEERERKGGREGWREGGREGERACGHSYHFQNFSHHIA